MFVRGETCRNGQESRQVAIFKDDCQRRFGVNPGQRGTTSPSTDVANCRRCVCPASRETFLRIEGAGRHPRSDRSRRLHARTADNKLLGLPATQG
jgi:hypothetical protein